MMEIKSANFVISNTDVKKCPDPDRHEYAFIGRSNVGKSSLINMLTNYSKLAKTSSSPGLMMNGIWWIYPDMGMPEHLNLSEDNSVL